MCLNGKCTQLRVGKNLLVSIPIRNGPKRDALASLLFNSALEYSIRKIQENQVGLKLNGAH
jgi:hypothetical protein